MPFWPRICPGQVTTAFPVRRIPCRGPRRQGRHALAARPMPPNMDWTLIACVLGRVGRAIGGDARVTGIRPPSSMTIPGQPGCRVRLRRGGLVWPGRPRDDGQQQTAHPPASCPTNWLQHTPANSPEGTWLGGALNTPAVSAKLSQANLISYIATAKTLPFFIIAQGDDDCQVPYGQSQELADALAKVGNTANLTIIPAIRTATAGSRPRKAPPDWPCSPRLGR